MSKDFVGDSSGSVKIEDMLEYASLNIQEDGTTDIEKLPIFGTDISSLFTGFSFGEGLGMCPVFKTSAELKTMLDNDELTDGDIQKLFYYNKYLGSQFNIINNENIPEGDDLRVGNIYSIDPSKNDGDSLRPVTQRAPVWLAGHGFNQNGNPLEENKVGALDLYYDENALMWRATQEFPVVGRVVNCKNKNPYDIEVFGVGIEDNQVTMPSGSSLVSSKKNIIKNVTYLNDQYETTTPSLSSGDLVNVSIDQPNGAYVCTKPETNSILIKNNGSEDIEEYSFVEIEELIVDQDMGKYYKVKKPTDDSLSTCFITEKAIKKGGYVLIGENYPKLVKFAGTTPSVGDNFGTTENLYTGQKDNSGYIVIGVNVDKVSVIKAAGSSGTSVNPYVLIAGTTDVAQTDTWDIENQPVGYDGVVVEAWFRIYWSGIGGDPIYQFVRQGIYNSAGSIIAIGAESRSEAFYTGECTL